MTVFIEPGMMRIAPRSASTSVSHHQISMRLRRGVAFQSERVSCTSVWAPSRHSSCQRGQSDPASGRLRKKHKEASYPNFPYVCPEPVL
eukprot:COSAG06_NODE_1147_length_10512_cov_5.815615_12_plen_89_part_00